MKCIAHIDVDAAGQCNVCGAGLCKTCMHNFTLPICPSCNLREWQAIENRIRGLVFRIPLFGLGFAFFLWFFTGVWLSAFLNGILGSILGTPLLLGVYWAWGIFTYFGWLWINDMTQNILWIRVNDTIFMVLLRKLFKIFFAGVFGILVGPYEIYRLWREAQEAKVAIALCREMIEGEGGL